ncbi:MAG: hypothetical protein KAG61_07315 [Bacteriovoracaceae bacterium]|nr:hypothetical protein [Bacteriovoracaceae bacterium]
MRLILITLLSFYTFSAFGIPSAANKHKGFDPFFDFDADYALFTGRVTDRDRSSSILKISSENGNIKFFKVGDPVEFTIAKNSKQRACTGNIRDIEKGYVVIFVKNLGMCWDASGYLRRGSILKFRSPSLFKRVEDASLYRMGLLKRREDYYKQMNEINHFIWSYDQQKVLVASEFDRKILELQKKKQKSIDELLNKKKYNVHLQKELAYRLDILDKDLDFYRIEAVDEEDLWRRDHDLGKSVGRRPQKTKGL